MFQSLGDGKYILVTFQNKAKYLIEEKYKTNSEMNAMQVEERMLSIVGEMIRNGILDMMQPEMYPSSHDLSYMEYLRSWIPKSLTKL